MPPFKKSKTYSNPLLHLAPGYEEKYEDKSFEETVAAMASEQKVSMAAAILSQATEVRDPSAFKIISGILEKQGFQAEKSLPITDDQYKKIIKIAARDLLA